MWKAGGPEAELVAKESVTGPLQYLQAKCLGSDLGQSSEDEQPSPR